MVFYQCEGLLLGAHNGSHGEDPELVPGTLVIPRSTAALFASAKSTEAFIKQAVEAAL
jgi:hypothetical protein